MTEFTTDEPITRYVSSVGNSQVPYPYAESDDWCYCLLEYKKTPAYQHPNRHNLGEVAYHYDAEYTKFDTVKIEGRNSYHDTEYQPGIQRYLRYLTEAVVDQQ